MSDFRYAQFCPLARAAEVLGERWTLLILRELFCGPQRFSDLRRRLAGVSTSVLSERLTRLEDRGLVQRRVLEPPAARTVYELGEGGRALERTLFELMRWGMRWLVPVPGDHTEPDWAALGLRFFARRDRCPARRFELEIVPVGDDGPPVSPPVRLLVESGADGAGVRALALDAPPGELDARVRGRPLPVLAAASGGASVRALAEAGQLEVTGSLAALEALPRLFDFSGVQSGPRDRDAGPVVTGA